MPAASKTVRTSCWDAIGCILVTAACHLQTLHKLHDNCLWKRSPCNTMHSPTPFSVWRGFQQNS
jgi:hypothetical protein